MKLFNTANKLNEFNQAIQIYHTKFNPRHKFCTRAKLFNPISLWLKNSFVQWIHLQQSFATRLHRTIWLRLHQTEIFPSRYLRQQSGVGKTREAGVVWLVSSHQTIATHTRMVMPNLPHMCSTESESAGRMTSNICPWQIECVRLLFVLPAAGPRESTKAFSTEPNFQKGPRRVQPSAINSCVQHFCNVSTAAAALTADESGKLDGVKVKDRRRYVKARNIQLESFWGDWNAHS